MRFKIVIRLINAIFFILFLISSVQFVCGNGDSNDISQQRATIELYVRIEDAWKQDETANSQLLSLCRTRGLGLIYIYKRKEWNSPHQTTIMGRQFTADKQGNVYKFENVPKEWVLNGGNEAVSSSTGAAGQERGKTVEDGQQTQKHQKQQEKQLMLGIRLPKVYLPLEREFRIEQFGNNVVYTFSIDWISMDIGFRVEPYNAIGHLSTNVGLHIAATATGHQQQSSEQLPQQLQQHASSSSSSPVVDSENLDKTDDEDGIDSRLARNAAKQTTIWNRLRRLIYDQQLHMYILLEEQHELQEKKLGRYGYYGLSSDSSSDGKAMDTILREKEEVLKKQRDSANASSSMFWYRWDSISENRLAQLFLPMRIAEKAKIPQALLPKEPKYSAVSVGSAAAEYVEIYVKIEDAWKQQDNKSTYSQFHSLYRYRGELGVDSRNNDVFIYNRFMGEKQSTIVGRPFETDRQGNMVYKFENVPKEWVVHRKGNDKKAGKATGQQQQQQSDGHGFAKQLLVILLDNDKEKSLPPLNDMIEDIDNMVLGITLPGIEMPLEREFRIDEEEFGSQVFYVFSIVDADICFRVQPYNLESGSGTSTANQASSSLPPSVQKRRRKASTKKNDDGIDDRLARNAAKQVAIWKRLHRLLYDQQLQMYILQREQHELQKEKDGNGSSGGAESSVTPSSSVPPIQIQGSVERGESSEVLATLEKGLERSMKVLKWLRASANAATFFAYRTAGSYYNPNMVVPLFSPIQIKAVKKAINTPQPTPLSRAPQLTISSSQQQQQQQEKHRGRSKRIRFMPTFRDSQEHGHHQAEMRTIPLHKRLLNQMDPPPSPPQNPIEAQPLAVLAPAEKQRPSATTVTQKSASVALTRAVGTAETGAAAEGDEAIATTAAAADTTSPARASIAAASSGSKKRARTQEDRQELVAQQQHALHRPPIEVQPPVALAPAEQQPSAMIVARQSTAAALTKAIGTTEIGADDDGAIATGTAVYTTKNPVSKKRERSKHDERIDELNAKRLRLELQEMLNEMGTTTKIDDFPSSSAQQFSKGITKQQQQQQTGSEAEVPFPHGQHQIAVTTVEEQQQHVAATGDGGSDQLPEQQQRQMPSSATSSQPSAAHQQQKAVTKNMGPSDSDAKKKATKER